MASDRLRTVGRRTFHLDLLPHLNRTDFVVRRRTWRTDEHSDQLLTIGSLNYSASIDQPRDLVRDLRRVADVLEQRFQSTRREAAPEPPRGGYGGDQRLPGLQGDDWVFSKSGLPMDYSRVGR